jgi:5-oxoprolinase (ATP-hydrolysing)
VFCRPTAWASRRSAALREQQFERPLTEIDGAAPATRRAGRGGNGPRSKPRACPSRSITTERRAHLRYKGSHQSLEVDFGTVEELRERFDAAHKARYGFAGADRELIFEALAVEAIGGASEVADSQPAGQRPSRTPVDHRDVTAGKRSIPFRSTTATRWRRGRPSTGPAIIKEPTGTNVIEPGWRADYQRLRPPDPDAASNRWSGRRPSAPPPTR